MTTMKEVNMPKTTIRNQTKTATKQEQREAELMPPLRWIATEYVPKKRWWWYVVLGWIGLTLTFLFLALGEWSIAAVASAAALALIVMYAVKPRVWHYTLSKTMLTVGKLTWPLEQFRAFTLEEISQGKNRKPVLVLILLPRGRFAGTRDVYLTGDFDFDSQITERLAADLPFDEAEQYQTFARILTITAIRTAIP